jgi:hypothetical protein
VLGQVLDVRPTVPSSQLPVRDLQTGNEVCLCGTYYVATKEFDARLCGDDCAMRVKMRSLRSDFSKSLAPVRNIST